MPLQTVEELRYVKHKIAKLYGQYNESVLLAEHVRIAGQEELKDRLLVVGRHRVYLFRKAKLQSSLAKDYHLYDLAELICSEKDSFAMRFRKNQDKLVQVTVHSMTTPLLVHTIQSSYAAATYGYCLDFLCNMQVSKSFVPDVEEPEKYPTAGGAIVAYEAQCSYFKSPYCRDIVRLIELMASRDEFELDLSLCPQVENPKVMLPLVGALRHNNYFLSLNINACKGNQNVLLMLANVIRFNTTITRLDMACLSSPSSFIVFGSSLLANTGHAIQVLDISGNKVPHNGIDAIASALEAYSHALLSLSVRNCALSKRSLLRLFRSFKANYGMSMSIEHLNVSENRLGRRGSHLLASWMNMVRDASHLRGLYLASTALSFVDVGRPLVHMRHLETLDVSGNKLNHASVQLLTLFLESSQAMRNLDVSRCSLGGEFIGKILATLLTNDALKKLRLHLDGNSIASDEDIAFLVQGLARGSNIHTLTLADTKLKATPLIRILDALQQHKSLEMLVLDNAYRGSKSGEANEALAQALALVVTQNSSIKAISLVKGYRDVISSFCNHMATNTSLLELNVSSNGFGDLGASSLAHMLRTNSSIRSLHLDDNLITFSGWQAVAQVPMVNKTLLDMPFPWRDYQRCIASLPKEKHPGFRRLLTDTKSMIARNRSGCSPALRTNELSRKRGVQEDIATPTEVQPLASLPLEMPEEIAGDTDTNFTFANDSSDEDETEMELLELQENFRRFSSVRDEGSTFSSSGGVDLDDDSFSDDPCDPFVAAVNELSQDASHQTPFGEPNAKKELPLAPAPELQQAILVQGSALPPVLTVPVRPPAPSPDRLSALTASAGIIELVPPEEPSKDSSADQAKSVGKLHELSATDNNEDLFTRSSTSPLAVTTSAGNQEGCSGQNAGTAPPPPPMPVTAPSVREPTAPSPSRPLAEKQECKSIGELLLMSMGKRRESLEQEECASDSDEYPTESDEEDDDDDDDW